jgi:hypothetical protein
LKYQFAIFSTLTLETKNMELNDDVYEQILTLAEEGDEFAENEIFGSAISKYQLALELLPDPKTDWEAATWLYVAL